MLNLFQHLLNQGIPVKTLFVYIMSNYERTTFYVGVTNNLERRVAEHKSLKGSVFTSKYKLLYLLYYEELFGATDAIRREKQLKNWRRDWKLNLIREMNPEMLDLARDWKRIDAETSSA
jgi:putative endonuclease